LQAFEHYYFDEALSALAFSAFCSDSTSAEFGESWAVSGAGSSPSLDGVDVAGVA
jgi:hypothetical protein